MDFHEKLQKLRNNANLTQEELAKKLFVSRTAVSKWESGRGYPSIDSLKEIAKTFHITIDELIGGDEIVDLAEQNIKKTNTKTVSLVCGVLDCFSILLFFLPVFGSGGAEGVLSVTLPALAETAVWLKAVFAAVVGLTALNGLCAVVIVNFDRPVWDRHRLITGLVLSVAATAVFLLSRQPYAGVFTLFLLVIKGFLLLKRK